MSIQFIFGSSGAGKSTELHRLITEQSQKNPDRNYFVIVPDQFTMQTQMDLVKASPNQGIMNVDVLSFARLSHRILEETGAENKAVLDDTGKNLILMKLAQDDSKDLEILGDKIHKLGYIHEVKSTISEFMQYGLRPDDIETMINYADGHGLLKYKLRDMQIIYRHFREYIEDKYVTTEETLDMLCTELYKSQLIPGSVIAFDGFTGFTPIQYRVLCALSLIAEKIYISMTLPNSENPNVIKGEQELFYLTKKTVSDVYKLADEAGCRVDDPIICTVKLPRFSDFPELAHLEKAIFRYPVCTYKGENTNRLRMGEFQTIGDEIRSTCIEIKKLIGQGYYYRDIAVVSGNLAGYADLLEDTFARFDIPMYMDRTRGILFNPFTEYIRSALLIVMDNFSRESMFHYLRTGMTGLQIEEIDRLENYVRRYNIKGKKAWTNLFVIREKTPNGKKCSDEVIKEYEKNSLEDYNRMRTQIITSLEPLMRPGRTASDYVKNLYEFIVQNSLQNKLYEYEKLFNEKDEPAKAREYAQIYGRVIALLEQIYSLLGDEKMKFKEFAEVLDAGLSEITVGTIPLSVDRVIVGDIKRTRLKPVKALFFLGVNDGNIPTNAGKGGIISDIDREFLTGSGVDIAPSPRQQMYIQKMYLYMNMTKPSDRLYISYAKTDTSFAGLSPAYLIETVKKIFPKMVVERPADVPIEDKLTCKEDGLLLLADYLRDYALGRMDDEEKDRFFALYELYSNDEKYRKVVSDMVCEALPTNNHRKLSDLISKALYGTVLRGSVSKLEKFVDCAYAYFIQYGLDLKERQEFEFERSDMGQVFHDVLEGFSHQLSERGLTWTDFSDNRADEILNDVITTVTAGMDNAVLYSSERNKAIVTRMTQILKRSVTTIRNQLQKGVMQPVEVEKSFSVVKNLGDIGKLRMSGRIDRLDRYETDDKVYVRIVDYKSSEHKMNLAEVYYGKQLQLVVYMNEALRMEKNNHPNKDVIPAALLYYHVNNPVIEAGFTDTNEEIEAKILKDLRMTGLVNDDNEIIRLMDEEFESESGVMKVKKTKDGVNSANSDGISEPDMTMVSQYVDRKIESLGRDILSGNIDRTPKAYKDKSPCTYCNYKHVCGIDPSKYGTGEVQFPELTKEEALAKMMQEIGEESKDN